MKYLAFLNNYDNRPCTAQLLWWYYYLLDHVPNVHFIVNSDFLNVDPNRWEYSQYQKAPYKYRNPAELHTDNVKVMPKVEDLPEFTFDRIPTLILRKAMLEPIPSIMEIVENEIKKHDITAVLLWCNNASVEEVCRRHGIPAIHNESGALRTPRFHNTCYFDFSGVNGNTEFQMRFEEFEKVSSSVTIFPREELLRIITQKNMQNYILSLYRTEPTYECGVALQVDVDTNLMTFNRDVTAMDLINMAAREYGGSLLIRNHPLSSIGYIGPVSLGSGIIDTSANSIEFLSKCKRVHTINSSVGFEAMMFGREVQIWGDNPFRCMQFMDEYTQLLALNFAVFSYLIPVKRLYDEAYYGFRINCKDEKTLYEEGQKYWLENLT